MLTLGMTKSRETASYRPEKGSVALLLEAKKKKRMKRFIARYEGNAIPELLGGVATLILTCRRIAIAFSKMFYKIYI